MEMRENLFCVIQKLGFDWSYGTVYGFVVKVVYTIVVLVYIFQCL
jgi:hypothetical protein